MNKRILFLLIALIPVGCGQSDKSSPKTGDAAYCKLVGVAQQALTFRELSVPTEKGTLKVTCYLDDRAKEVCKGEYADGETVPTAGVEHMLSALHVDPNIGIALNTGCQNKTLLLSVEPKLDVPETDSSEFCFWTDENNTMISCNGKSVSQSEAEAINNQRLETLKSELSAARKSALEAFMAINPNLVSEAQKNAYAESLYGALNIKMDACGWPDFVETNRDILAVAEYRGLVDDMVPEKCESSLEYKILLNANKDASEPSGSASFGILSDKSDLASFETYGLNAGAIDAIDFSEEVVMFISGGEKPTTGYRLEIDDICDDSEIVVYISHCAGQSDDTALSEPIMLMKLPKNEYVVVFRNRERVCE